MKYVILLLTLSLSLFAQSSWANEEPELIEEKAVEVQVSQDSDQFIELKVGKKSTYKVNKAPDPQKMREALGLVLPDEIKQQLIALGQPIPEVDPLEGFNQLSEVKKEEFLKSRIFFLTAMAKFLNSTKFAIGLGSLVGDQISFLKDKLTRKKPEWQKTPFKERYQLGIETMLQALDYKLWSQAPLVVDSNEYGLFAAAGFMSVSGLRKNGYSLHEELGLAIAFNKQTKSLVVEVYHLTENYKDSLSAVGAIGLHGKLAVMMRNVPMDTNVMQIKGKTFYPPMVPAFSSDSATYFAAGPSTSLGLPPPPLADILTWENSFERNTILKVRVSPLTKGFVRVHIGDLPRVGKIVFMRVQELIDMLAKYYHSLRTPRCARILSS